MYERKISARVEGKVYDESLEPFFKYLDSILRHDSPQDIVRKTGTFYSNATQIIKHAYIPSSDIMQSILAVYEPDEELTEFKGLCWENTKLIFEYWNIVNPDAEPTTRIGILFKHLLHQKGIDRKVAVTKLGVTQPRYSNMTNGKAYVSYSVFLKFAEILDMNPFDFISLLNDIDGERERREFSELVRGTRLNMGISIDLAAQKCNSSVSHYLKVENATATVTLSTLKNLSALYDLDCYTLAKLAVNGKLANSDTLLKLKVSPYEPSSKASGIPKKEGNLVKLLTDLAGTRYITDNSSYMPAKWVCTLVFMFLLDAGTWDYKSEELYFLERLDQTREYKQISQYKYESLSNTLVSQSLPEGIVDYQDIFAYYKDLYSLNYRDLTRLTPFRTRQSIQTALSKYGYFKNLYKMYVLHKEIKCPLSLGIESYINHRDKKLSDDVFTLDEVFTLIEHATDWGFYGNCLKHEVLEEIFTIIFSDAEKLNKLQKVMDLNIPKPELSVDSFS